jgi:hypothetical protein
MSNEFFEQMAAQLKAEQPTETQEVVETPQEVVETTEQEVETQETQNTNETQTETKEEIPWWEQKQETETQVKTNEQKITEQEAIDEEIKLLMEYKKNGKSLSDLVKDYQIEDLTKWSDDQFVKEGLKKYMNLTPEETEQAVYEYDNASIFQKKQWAENFKIKFEQENQMKLKQLTGSNEQMEGQRKAMTAKYEQEMDQYSQSIVGKEVYGLKVTDEMSKDLKKFINEEFSLQREDGSFDIEKVYSVALWLRHGGDLVKANITKAKNEGREQVIKEVTNPSKNSNSNARSAGSGLEAIQDAFDSRFSGN